MKTAELLSDLTSLRPEVCDPNAALALVSVRPEGGQSSGEKTTGVQDDPGLKRAKDLLGLHENVKMSHPDGVDQELNELRERVQKVMREV